METNLNKEKELLAIKTSIETYCTAQGISFPNVTDDQLKNWATSNVEFMTYINANSEEEVSLYSLCIRKVGKLKLDSMFMNLLQSRNIVLNTFMKDSLALDEASFKVKTADLRNMPEQLKSPNYRVEVSLK